MNKNKEKVTYEDILIENDSIKYIGDNYTGEYDKIIDASGKIVMPGLINCHAHVGMSIFRATNDDYTLDKWLKEFIWPIESTLNDEDIYNTTMLGLIEMIKTGTTCFNDMYIRENGAIKAFSKSKLRCVFGNGITNDRNISEIESVIKSNNNSLISFNIAPHALYTTNMDLLKRCVSKSIEYDLPMHIHLAENKKEVSDIDEQYHMLPCETLNEAGILDRKTILAHCTFLSDKDLEFLKGKDVSICTNPVSNLNLGCGIADIRKYINSGINVCLGTDGAGSGNNYNMFYHMSFVDNLQKGKYEDPTIMGSYEVLKMATINGAKALGFNDIGSIEVGKKADIIIVDTDNIDNYPVNNKIIHIVHNGWASKVDTTIVNGNILMENKKLNIEVDIEKLKDSIDKINNRINN